MWFFSSRKARLKTSARPHRRSCPLRVTMLEERCCPSSTSYTVTDLGLSPVSYSATGYLAGHENTRLGINNALQVVGQAGAGNASVAPNHAFVWQNGTFTDLGTLGGPASRATAINNAASPEIVGWADTSLLDSSGNYIYHACLWQQNGTGGWSLTDLGTLPGSTDSAAYAINNSGQVVGNPNSTSGHPFVWQNGVMTDLNTLVPANSALGSAYGINDNGQITGGANQKNLGGLPYLLTPSTSNPGTYTETVLPSYTGGDARSSNAWSNPFYFTTSYGMSVNSSGQVAGVGQLFAAFWANTTTIRNVGSTNTQGGAFGLNNSGQVVGSLKGYKTKALYAFIWSGGKTATDLNTLIPSNSGWNLIEADGINAPTASLPSGSIVGYGIYNGQTHMFLAIDPPVEDGSPSDSRTAATGQTASNHAEDFVPSGDLLVAAQLGPLTASPNLLTAGSSVPLAGTITANVDDRSSGFLPLPISGLAFKALAAPSIAGSGARLDALECDQLFSEWAEPSPSGATGLPSPLGW
jgi:probable HAF family extracellular repeat protein